MARVFLFFLMVILMYNIPVHARGEDGDHGTEVDRDTSVFQIGEIIVRDRAIASIEDASTTTVITDKEIKKRSDKTLDESLQMVPGINVYQNQKGNMVFDMRGFEHAKVAILVDGIPFEEVFYSGGGDISRIPVMNASRIVINRGVSSALYGTRGTFGTINIITKRPEKLFAEVQGEYGQYGNYTLNIAQGAPLGDFYYLFSGSILKSNGYEVSRKLDRDERRMWFDKLVSYDVYGKTLGDITLASVDNYINDTGMWNHTGFSRHYLDGKMGYNFSRDIEAGISASFYKQTDQDFNGFYPNANARFDDESGEWVIPSDPNAYTSDGKSSLFVNQAFNWPHDYRFSVSPYFRGDFGMLSVRGNIFYVKQENELLMWYDQDETILGFMGNRSYHEETSYGVNLYPSYRITSQHKLSLGLMCRREDFEKRKKAYDNPGGKEIVVTEMSAQYLSLAVEDEVRFTIGGGDIALTAGISYDAQDFRRFRDDVDSDDELESAYRPDDDSTVWGTRDSFNPVLGVVYDPIKGFLRLRGSFSIKTEFPSLKVYSDIESAGDPFEVDPERSYNGNAGFELFLLNGRVSLRNDYFYTEFKDKIERLWDPSNPTTDYVFTNIDGMMMQGLENTVAARLERIAGMELSISFTYVYIYARNEDDSSVTMGKAVERTPEHQFIAQILCDFITDTSLVIWGQHMRNQVVYVMREAPPAGAGLTYSTGYYKTAKLHDPFFLNARLSQIIGKNFDVYIICKNILDDYRADPFNPGPGRMFYFGVDARL